MTKEELERSKKEVMSRMGISLPGGIDGGLADLVGEEMDITNQDAPVKLEEDGGPKSDSVGPAPSSDALTPMDPAKKPIPRGKRQREQYEKEEERRVREAEDEEFRGLSARQINALKRKRKAGGSAPVAGPSKYVLPTVARVVSTRDADTVLSSSLLSERRGFSRLSQPSSRPLPPQPDPPRPIVPLPSSSTLKRRPPPPLLRP